MNSEPLRVLSVRPWRPPGPGNTLGPLLAERGIALVEAPLQRVVLAEGSAPAAALRMLREGEPEHLLITHARALDALTEHSRRHEDLPQCERLRPHRCTRVHVAGRTTAMTAEEHGLAVHTVWASASEMIRSVAAEIAADLGPAARDAAKAGNGEPSRAGVPSFVLFCSAGTRTTAAEQPLRDAGAHGSVIALYVLAPQPLPDGLREELTAARLDAVVIASKETVRLLGAEARTHGFPLPPVVAVGEAVADTARAAGMDVAGTAESGREQDLARTVELVLRNR